MKSKVFIIEKVNGPVLATTFSAERAILVAKDRSYNPFNAHQIRRIKVVLRISEDGINFTDTFITCFQNGIEIEE